ncbi:MAG TPA: carboxypeptidase-like regulatory domain-containing protein, partial [Blastocatellia bacterium]|nr:carboxypeptidase-like regulatory domain-containing protein [Blastocatellia bacterium]
MQRTLLMFVVVCLCLVNAIAQTSISGTVTDQNGTVIKGARVSLRRDAIVLATTTTNDAGHFSLSHLVDGELRLI